MKKSIYFLLLGMLAVGLAACDASALPAAAPGATAGTAPSPTTSPTRCLTPTILAQATTTRLPEGGGGQGTPRSSTATAGQGSSSSRSTTAPAGHPGVTTPSTGVLSPAQAATRDALFEHANRSGPVPAATATPFPAGKPGSPQPPPPAAAQVLQPGPEATETHVLSNNPAPPAPTIQENPCS